MTEISFQVRLDHVGQRYSKDLLLLHFFSMLRSQWLVEALRAMCLFSVIQKKRSHCSSKNHLDCSDMRLMPISTSITVAMDVGNWMDYIFWMTLSSESELELAAHIQTDPQRETLVKKLYVRKGINEYLSCASSNLVRNFHIFIIPPLF